MLRMGKLAWSPSSTTEENLGPIVFLTATEQRGKAVATGIFNTRGCSHAGHIHEAWWVPLHIADMNSELSVFSVEDKSIPNVLEGEHVHIMFLIIAKWTHP